ncbi:MAG: indole-3-glycerol-phosphate synthase, partial [Methanomicrobiales archaeon]|nr:indole-3-glycerol-phosphate synthase [Methanomicrobiales archaeon]
MLADILRSTEARIQDLSVPSDVPAHGEHRSLKAAIRGARNRNAVIAELKYASPSRGIIRSAPEPIVLARDLVDAGCIAISVITEPRYFGGNAMSLMDVRKTVNVPVLRKDFIIDERQLQESKMLGADAVLLIAGVLQDRLRAFVHESCRLGLEPLVETHTPEEIRAAHAAGAEIIGINNRDLRTMKVNLATTVELSEAARRGPALIISESGLCWPCDVRALRRYCDAFLIGSAITAA